MKKKIICLILAIMVLFGLSTQTYANHLTGKQDWLVTFTPGEKMEANWDKGKVNTEFSDEVRQLQPGDDITFTVKLTNQHPQTTDWYMTNKVLKTLEETKAIAKGGAYSYLLTYSGPGGEKELYNSETVGGDNSQGMLEATSALEDYFYLDTLANGDMGEVNLVVMLDGETQNNSYMNTLGDLQMNFAVELKSQPTTPETPTGGTPPTTPQTVVKTGDQTNLLPLFIIMAASGIGFLILAISSVRSRRRAKEGRTR